MIGWWPSQQTESKARLMHIQILSVSKLFASLHSSWSWKKKDDRNWSLNNPAGCCLTLQVLLCEYENFSSSNKGRRKWKPAKKCCIPHLYKTFLLFLWYPAYAGKMLYKNELIQIVKNKKKTSESSNAT